MRRALVLGAVLLAACGDARPRADTTAMLPLPDTVGAAGVTAPDTVKPAPAGTKAGAVARPAVPVGPRKPPATKSPPGIVGRDSAMAMDPNHPRTIRVDTTKRPGIVGRDSAMAMDPMRPRIIRVDTSKKRDTLPPR